MAHRPMKQHEIDEACTELKKRTSKILSRMYYTSPSEKRHRRNQRIKHRRKKKNQNKQNKGR